MWDLIVSVPDHCLSFYFITFLWISSPFSFFFIKKSCGAPGFEPVFSPGQVILGF